MRIDIPGKRPIQFEGQTISDAAKYFELVPGYKDFPPDVQEWILDLKYAWARERQADSELIMRACDLLEEATHRNREKLFQSFKKVFPKEDSAELLQDWLLSITTIRSVAEGRGICCWTILPLDDEIDFFLKTCLALVRKAQTTQGKQILSGDFFQRVENGSKEEKLKFINDVVDSYSDRIK
jgi:hypothetical protein